MAGQCELGVIGAGNMAEGIVAAAVGTKLYAAERIIVSDVSAERCALFAKQFGVKIGESNRQVVAGARRVLLAVKPQNFANVSAEFADVVTPEHFLVSILAGVSTKKIESAFPKVKARVVRVMPNLPIKVGAGIAGVCAGAHATEQDLADVQALFDAGGSSVLVRDESLMDVVTAVAGSGPAYFYYFVEAIVAGASACGMPEADALKLAEHTCLGAARMMLETGEPPAELRRKVTSKGGTTQAALEHMAAQHVGDAIRDAVQAAFQRGRELGS
jgi:pyrroline-5-carboxylate reductase